VWFVHTSESAGEEQHEEDNDQYPKKARSLTRKVTQASRAVCEILAQNVGIVRESCGGGLARVGFEEEFGILATHF
jgi:hypothetical protein